MLHFTFLIFYFAPEAKGVLPTQDPGLGRGTQGQGPGLGPARAKNAAVSTVIHHPTPRRPALHVYLKT